MSRTTAPCIRAAERVEMLAAEPYEAQVLQGARPCQLLEQAKARAA
jgi:hypothetical protein